MSPPPRETWSSRAGFVLACIGSAVGIGNIWRFPYVVGANGGGAFLLPYAAAVLLLGLPLLMLELGLGRRLRASVVPALAAIDPRLGPIGLGLVLVQTVILSYYLVITGWVLAYVVAFTARRPIAFEAFTASYTPLLFFALAVGVCFGVVRAGVRGGIERLSSLLMPLLFVMVAGLAAVALTLPGAARGVAFYLTPDFGRLHDPLVWTAAFGQAFFSLGVGTGIMLTFGSYAPGGSAAGSALLVTGADLLVALLGGLVVFPVVFSVGLDPAAGAELAFVTLPRIFESMPFGLAFGAAFFLLLSIAALTSAVSILELPVATLIDVYGIGRGRAALCVTAGVAVLGLPSALSYTALRLELLGTPVLDLKDFAFGTVGMVVAALLLTLVAGWGAGETLLREAVGGWWRPLRLIARFLIPAALLATLGARLLATGLS